MRIIIGSLGECGEIPLMCYEWTLNLVKQDCIISAKTFLQLIIFSFIQEMSPKVELIELSF